MYYRKKPIIVKAIQWTGWNLTDVAEFCPGIETRLQEPELGASVKIKTLEGSMIGSPGDWIVCGIKGEFYPIKPGIFADSYEPCDPPATQ